MTTLSPFGSGLGTVIGSSIGSNDITQGQNAINSNVSNVESQTSPFVSFGQSFLSPATSAISNLQNTANQTQSYNQFMQGYTNTPAAQYQLEQANAQQNSSAAAKGNLLSGSNERALSTIDNGIISQNANNAYNEYLSGNNQQFSQLNSALSDMFNAIGVGTTATGQNVSAVNSQNQATAALSSAQAKEANSKGSGLGSMFSGIASLAKLPATF